MRKGACVWEGTRGSSYMIRTPCPALWQSVNPRPPSLAPSRSLGARGKGGRRAGPGGWVASPLLGLLSGALSPSSLSGSARGHRAAVAAAATACRWRPGVSGAGARSGSSSGCSSPSDAARAPASPVLRLPPPPSQGASSEPPRPGNAAMQPGRSRRRGGSGWGSEE